MKRYFKILLITIFTLITNIVVASTLTIDAIERGINSTCTSSLGQLEETFDLNGLNITFAHLSDPSLYTSLHLSTKKYNNGNSVFSATLSPDGEYCYLSTVVVTSVNSQSCNDIAMLKIAEDSTLKVSFYSDKDYSIITPEDNSYQLILISNGEQSCTMAESRMMWPGR